MKMRFKNLTFPYKTTILYLSLFILLLPYFMLPQFVLKISDHILKIILLLSTLFATIGFIYSTLGFHFQILKGDELRLRIHLESLNAAFSITLISFFILMFIFLNFSPTMLNWILVILAVILIVSYLLATQFIKEKYQ